MKRLPSWLAIGLSTFVLFLLLAQFLFLGWLKWSGDRYWQYVQNELRAKGEPLSYKELVSPAPPDSENFFTDPIWRQLSDDKITENELLINQWKIPLTPKEVDEINSILPDHPSPLDRQKALQLLVENLRATNNLAHSQQAARICLDFLEPAAPLLSKITQLSKRPLSFFPVRYQDGLDLRLPYVAPMLSIGKLLQYRSIAHLALDKSAYADTQTLLALSSTQCSVPLLIPHLVRLAILRLALGVINTGIEQHQWNEEELANFQRYLEKIHSVQDLCFALRGDRLIVNSDSLLNLDKTTDFPKKPSLFMKCAQLFFRNYEKAYYSEFIQHLIESIRHSAQSGLNTTTLFQHQESNDFHPKKLSQKLDFISSIIVRLASSSITNSIQKTVETQTQISQTILACALERYYITHHAYPTSLDTLLPSYLTAIPKEPTTGSPMHYHLLNKELFLLWAPSWKLQTLHGKSGEFKGEGDIVWNQLLPIKSREDSSIEKKTDPFH